MHLNLNWELVRGIFTLTVLAGLGLGLIIYSIRNAADPAQMIFKWAITLPLLTLAFLSVRLFGPAGPFVIVMCAIILSWMWTPHLGGLLSKPLTSIFDGGDLPPEPKPFYSIALSKQKQGRYLEAVADVRQQLERFPNDVEGQMLLAQILAEDLKDLPGAELTIERLVAQSGHAPKNIAFALYSLADWHLKFGQDREAARRALQKIVDLLPDSEFSLGAAQRIAHLGSTDMLLAPGERRKFAVPEGVKNLGLRVADHKAPTDKDPEQEAAEYVRHLEQHPFDWEAREKLAVIYANHYARLDLATNELEQLLAEPNRPPRLLVHWLNLLADLQIRHGADFDTVSATLNRIIERFPNLAAAELARSRLAILRLELKANATRQSVKLGTYEQNIGLKRAGGKVPGTFSPGHTVED